MCQQRKQFRLFIDFSKSECFPVKCAWQLSLRVISLPPHFSYAGSLPFFLLELLMHKMLSSLHTILVDLAFELFLDEIKGQYWLHTLHGNIIGLKNNWVDSG